MFVPNGTLVIFIASFGLFILLLDAIMLKPVGKAIAKRHEKMQNDLDAAREARQKAAGLVESYEAHLKQKRTEAHGLITSTVASANKQKADKLASVHKDGMGKLETAKAEIASERTNLIDQLVAIERELVEEITQKVLGERVAVQLDASKVRKNLEET
jgi:F-type H+-transporting ATPase subunit b